MGRAVYEIGKQTGEDLERLAFRLGKEDNL
jgi:hypothetical protein